MNKFVYFMAVGLAFTALQVATVEAGPMNADGSCPEGEEDIGSNWCGSSSSGSSGSSDSSSSSSGSFSCPEGMTDIGSNTCVPNDDPNLNSSSSSSSSSSSDGAATDTCAAMQGTARDDCYGAKSQHHGMMDPRTDPPQPFSPADEAIYQVYADECESNGGTISEASMGILITPPHNFTRLQVERLCQDSAHTPGAGGDTCADRETPALIAACVAKKTGAGS